MPGTFAAEMLFPKRVTSKEWRCYTCITPIRMNEVHRRAASSASKITAASGGPCSANRNRFGTPGGVVAAAKTAIVDAANDAGPATRASLPVEPGIAHAAKMCVL